MVKTALTRSYFTIMDMMRGRYAKVVKGVRFWFYEADGAKYP